jgi:hypothetical protein
MQPLSSTAAMRAEQDGRLIVNELVGYGRGQPHFEGTYLTSGGVVELKLSSGVDWSFTYTASWKRTV